MPKQKVPDIDFDFFVIGEIKELFKNNEIFINKEYQRGDIWKLSQKIELIKSVDNRYSIGVIVLFINDDNKYEILDGQQRLMTINKYLNDEIDLRNTDIQNYSENELPRGRASKYQNNLIWASCTFLYCFSIP